MYKSKLFSDQIPPSCAYCKFGFVSQNGRSVLCEKKGVTEPHDSCKRYLYAPLKRVPKRPRALPQFDHSDFEL